MIFTNTGMPLKRYQFGMLGLRYSRLLFFTRDRTTSGACINQHLTDCQDQ